MSTQFAFREGTLRASEHSRRTSGATEPIAGRLAGLTPDRDHAASLRRPGVRAKDLTDQVDGSAKRFRSGVAREIEGYPTEVDDSSRAKYNPLAWTLAARDPKCWADRLGRLLRHAPVRVARQSPGPRVDVQ